jgi:hypothetical protein
MIASKAEALDHDQIQSISTWQRYFAWYVHWKGGRNPRQLRPLGFVSKFYLPVTIGRSIQPLQA